MKTFTLAIIMFLFFSQKISAQQHPWAQPGAHWYFSAFNALSFDGYREVWKDANDTVINGINCDVFHLRDIGNAPFWPSPHTFIYANRYTYQSNDSVFFWNGSVFKILYAFNTSAFGDWITGEDDPTACQDDTIKIMQVSTVNINGINLKQLIPETFVFQPDPSQPNYRSLFFNDTIYERIGHLGGFLPLGECFTDNTDYKLRCYSDSSGFSYTSNIVPYCDFITSVKEITTDDEIKIYPSPANDKITINFSSQNHLVKNIFLSDLNGRKINKYSTSETSEKINVSTVTNGIYFLIIDIENNLHFEKIIIQH